jgi:Fe-S cluster biosynthesis and repair protein YggX
MDNAARIAQFENMTQADPTNEMAHFSLGKAYADATRFADAAKSYLRCIELVPDMSKAYQLAGENLVKSGNNARAIEVLTQGYTIAAGKGDLMPKTAMAKLMKDLGAEIPDVAPPSGASALGIIGGGGAISGLNIDPSGPLPDGYIRCAQSGKIGTKLARQPFKGPVGTWIQANIAAESWDTWIKQGTKVINELRLDLSRDKDQEAYDQHMREYLGVPEDVR